MLLSESVPIGPITHYTRSLDETGRPLAVPEDHADAVALLPEGWDDTFWDWQPRFDPKGQWVQRVGPKREDQWRQLKRARADSLKQPLQTSFGPLQVDPASMEALRGRVLRTLLPNPPLSIEWTMADDTTVSFTPTQFQALVARAEDRLDALHKRSREVRAEIFDPARTPFDVFDLE
jgi:hypothetical protein